MLRGPETPNPGWRPGNGSPGPRADAGLRLGVGTGRVSGLREGALSAVGQETHVPLGKPGRGWAAEALLRGRGVRAPPLTA